MPNTTISSRELNHDIGRAKKAAQAGPVIITDRGRPAFVLTTFQNHRQANKKNFKSLLDAVAMQEEDDIEIDLPYGGFYHRHIDLD